MNDSNRSTPDSAASSPPDARNTALEARRASLLGILSRHQRVLVAFSGGVDSAYLLYAALEALGPERVLAVTGVSDSLATRELDEAKALAARLGATHRIVATSEFDDPRYVANPQNRCYFCKSELYDKLAPIAAAEGFDVVVDGTNQDDVQDVRPGRQAARERGVASPLLEAGLTKQDIRELSRAAGLPTWDKPEMPCLSSRLPFGTAVDPAKLRQIETAEEGLRAAGIRGARVRHHGDVARIELPPDTLGRLGEPGFRELLTAALRAAGFRHLTVDLEGYRKGNFNQPRSETRVEWRAAPTSRDSHP